ncbi:DegT/DnrJ/EryC1/StrS family aminotransferase [Coxiella endosymbiont of Amblyomma americanum]|uniref:DegT/DnrJ/EryC1/StrS family aminotransferase n=1 Tax=Coxiella endosymbiont of Amblyomma americanum TaxID=325775 RepID=UPI00057CD1B9|nr:DegT/DnrJ/EryC1/StrS family aminotransferase [Coxiella endosymbiont of Amblyomma americanum]AJC50549.1 aminotransferase DegT [Coxiella endosymbiont of Amblyomma americanum]AUJ58884.1 DegT/DnrJ/EryC1/StrS family aminotransferase [Coxiella-like endosymbiont of Amblyomma americanum]
MKFIDLSRQYHQIKNTVNKKIQNVLNHGQYIMGPEVEELEQRLSAWVGVRHCITLSNGTMALLVALLALGIGSGDEVITSSFSFFATAEAIIFLGAKPVFIDINPHAYNIEPSQIEPMITKQTKAIVPVSLYGQCSNITKINAIAHRYEIPVIEDGAQSLGATHWGRQSCGMTTIGCTSFFPSKPLGCYGDGGACFTNDDILAEKMRLIRDHGQKTRCFHVKIGLNMRFDSLKAAILLAKLEIFQNELECRQRVAKWYSQKLSDYLVTPYIENGNVSVFAQYTIRVERREEIRRSLMNIGIPTAVYYPYPLNKQPAVWNYLQEKRNYPEAEFASKQVLSLPFHPYLTKEQVDYICKELLRTILI